MDINSEVGEGFNDFDVVTGNWHKGTWEEGSVGSLVLEYACPIWHSSLSKQQTTLLEDVQRRAVQIIVGNSPYAEACCMLGIQSLTDRVTFRTLYKQTVNNELHSLHYLFPAKRDTPLIYRLQFVQHLVHGHID